MIWVRQVLGQSCLALKGLYVVFLQRYYQSHYFPIFPWPWGKLHMKSVAQLSKTYNRSYSFMILTKIVMGTFYWTPTRWLALF